MAFVNLLSVIYPVGSFYLSRNSTSPASIVGGSWTQITNAALRAGSSVGYTGSDTHTLTANEMPKHSHSFTWSWNSGTQSLGGDTWSITLQNPWQNGQILDTVNGIQDQGGGVAHSVVQRCYNCYIWYRTA